MEVRVQPHRTLPRSANLETLLPVVLTELQSIQTSTVRFQEWDWSPTSLQLLATALPTLAHLHIAIDTHQRLNDELLLGLQVIHTHTISLTVRGLGPLTQPPVAPWPPVQLRVDSLYLADLLRLPFPGVVDGAVRCVSVKTLNLPGVTEESTQDLMSRLPHFEFKRAPYTDPFTLLCNGASEADLLAQLSLVPYITFADTFSADSLTVYIAGPMTYKVMEAMRDLPRKGEEINLEDATWPLDDSEYTRLGHCLPMGYRCIRVSGHNPDRFKSISKGVTERRKGLDLPKMILCCYGEQPVRYE